MALHINLYHEIHKHAEMERRDPVKLASLGLLVAMILLVGWYFYRSSAVRGIERRRADLQAQWAKVEPQLKDALEKEPQLLTRQKSNQALVERLHGRFYWAPLLARFQALVPENVQIVSITGELEPAPDGGRGTVSLLLKGMAAGALPRAAAEEFRQGLQAGLAPEYSGVTAVFDANSLEDGLEVIALNGQNLPTANFRIKVAFKQPASAPGAPKAK